MGFPKDKMIDFKKWFEEKLTVSSFPHKEHVDFSKFKGLKIVYAYKTEFFSKYAIVINVSDFSSLDYHDIITMDKALYYWFPLNEIKGDIGLNSIYAALNILYDAYKNNWSVLLHCFNGSNRSKLVAACFHFMITGEHIHQGNPKYYNRIYSNSAKGKIPLLPDMEQFLRNCYKVFTEPYAEIKFGPLDFCKKDLPDF